MATSSPKVFLASQVYEPALLKVTLEKNRDPFAEECTSAEGSDDTGESPGSYQVMIGAGSATTVQDRLPGCPATRITSPWNGVILAGTVQKRK